MKIASYYRIGWFFAFALFFPLLTSLPPVASESGKLTGTVVFMRHALAPGNGDPNDFSIDDCTTQRNLDETGRRQARAIGKKLSAAEINFSAVYSSYWCRCLETAKLLELGPVTPFDGLNSFYQGHAPRDKTLLRLNEKLASLPSSSPPLLMVTHFVTIQAITGLSVRSGDLVIYNLKNGVARELSLSSL